MQAFNGKKWEKFNSEKVASLAYARIQGKAALVTHFQNSSLMNEDKRCRPILFHSEGQEPVDQVTQLSYYSLLFFSLAPDTSASFTFNGTKKKKKSNYSFLRLSNFATSDSLIDSFKLDYASVLVKSKTMVPTEENESFTLVGTCSIMSIGIVRRQYFL